MIILMSETKTPQQFPTIILLCYLGLHFSHITQMIPESETKERQLLTVTGTM